MVITQDADWISAMNVCLSPKYFTDSKTCSCACLKDDVGPFQTSFALECWHCMTHVRLTVRQTTSSLLVILPSSPLGIVALKSKNPDRLASPDDLQAVSRLALWSLGLH